ncbi:hypothetical protein GCM10010207_36660 [Streptomyces atratus]|nr:hypothetical protein GCM10010207_36660 [Streptomyces atratus]
MERRIDLRGEILRVPDEELPQSRVVAAELAGRGPDGAPGRTGQPDGREVEAVGESQ